MGCSDSKPAPQQKKPTNKKAAPAPKKEPEAEVEPEVKAEEPAAPAEEPKVEAPVEEAPKPAPKKKKVASPKKRRVKREPKEEDEPEEVIDYDAPIVTNVTDRQRVQLTLEMARLRGEINQSAISVFMKQYDMLVKGQDGLIAEDRITPVDELPSAKALPKASGDLSAALSKTVVLKLNGGLGTGMGLSKAKSLLEVKQGKKFLDLIVQQVNQAKQNHSKNLSFMLLNSFSTAADTKEFVEGCGVDVGQWDEINLLQNKVPKITTDLKPAHDETESNNWCPPGHGDLFSALFGSGKLADLVKEGKEYLFVSNSDNLGATLDVNILKWFADSDKAFVMEVCERSDADKKGGHLAKRGQAFCLRESAQCPDSDQKEFQNIQKHKYFNTNNLWIKLPTLRNVMANNGGVLNLPLIRNTKTVDPTDRGSQTVYQLETAMGAAIESFGQQGQALVVGRERFAPVKTCNDLLAIRSDAYDLTDEHTVKLASERGGVPPNIQLGDNYRMVDDLEKATQGYDAIPSLKNCNMLKVAGTAPLRFLPGTSFVGEVLIDAGTRDSPQDVPAGEHSGDIDL
eukprot:Rhum_TRINITY_DN22771_c0_g1::Rhum_TRINITY_DN22771_c0_g1_i1::g.176079::m.176079/K00963/UGP2, galU, galF; UTP--glucose-1-phosphate uridylyltransferase